MICWSFGPRLLRRLDFTTKDSDLELFSASCVQFRSTPTFGIWLKVLITDREQRSAVDLDGDPV